jgi:hypothetical protein
MELKEYHYVYYSYEEYGRGYFGSRTCKCLTEEDIKYFGSFKDKTFKPTQKIILKTYATREEAYADEIILQEYYKVVENPHFANRAYQTTTKFYYKPLCSPMYGKFHTERTKNKMSKSRKGRVFTEGHRKNISKSLVGHKIKQETKDKISNTRKNKNIGVGKKHSEETKLKIGNKHKGKVVSKETVEKYKEHFRQEYILVSPFGEIIKEYGTKREICKKYNFQLSSFIKVLNKKQNKHKGWVFLIGGDNLYVNYSEETPD